MRKMMQLMPPMAATVLLGAFMASVFAAGEDSRSAKAKPRYKLVAGMGYSVCERYVRMLNAFPPDAPPILTRVI